MGTRAERQPVTAWLIGAIALMGLLWWMPARALAILTGAACAALALALVRDQLAHRRPPARVAILLGCLALGLVGGGASAIAPVAPMALVLALILATFMRGQYWSPRIDRTTGLPTAPAFAERAEEELSRGLRFGRPAALAIVALDQAPAVRATFGKRACDQALRRVAEALRSQTRGYDLLARLDSGRFVILLPETTRDEALAITDRMRAAIGDIHFIPAGQDGSVALSATIGLAAHPWDGDSARALLEQAERATHQPQYDAAMSELLAVIRADRPPPPREAFTGRAFTPPPWAVPAYIAAIWLAAAALFFATFRPFVWDSWELFVAITAIGIAARQMRIDVYGRGTISPAPVVFIAAGILFGPTEAMIIGCAVGLLAWPWTASPRVYIFDAGSYALTGGLLALCVPPLNQAFPDTGPYHLPLLIHGLALGGVCFIVNTALFGGVITLHEGSNPLADWRERYGWLLPHTLTIGVLGVFMAVTSLAFGPLGAIIFAVPTFMLRFVTKQYVDQTKEHVAALREAHAQLTQKNSALVESMDALHSSYKATLSAFSGMLDARDSETEGHSQRVVSYAVAIGRAMGLDAKELAMLEVGALLHDIGKVGVADAILRKNGPLNAEEWAEMRRHPEIGYELTTRIPFLEAASPIVRHHHEWWNGKGYPDGLRGEDIPLAARIFTVADSFDAMVSDRPYRPGRPIGTALEEIRRCAGEQFDPQVVEIFIRLVSAPDWGETLRLSQLAAQKAGGQFTPAS